MTAYRGAAIVPRPTSFQKGNSMLVAQLARADYLAGRFDVMAWLRSPVYRAAYIQERSDLLSAIAR